MLNSANVKISLSVGKFQWIRIWSYKAFVELGLKGMHLKCQVPKLAFPAMTDSRQVF